MASKCITTKDGSEICVGGDIGVGSNTVLRVDTGETVREDDLAIGAGALTFGGTTTVTNKGGSQGMRFQDAPTYLVRDGNQVCYVDVYGSKLRCTDGSDILLTDESGAPLQLVAAPAVQAQPEWYHPPGLLAVLAGLILLLITKRRIVRWVKREMIHTKTLGPGTIKPGVGEVILGPGTKVYYPSQGGPRS